jgi:hypothetical protein
MWNRSTSTRSLPPPSPPAPAQVAMSLCRRNYRIWKCVNCGNRRLVTPDIRGLDTKQFTCAVMEPLKHLDLKLEHRLFRVYTCAEPECPSITNILCGKPLVHVEHRNSIATFSLRSDVSPPPPLAARSFNMSEVSGRFLQKLDVEPQVLGYDNGVPTTPRGSDATLKLGSGSTWGKAMYPQHVGFKHFAGGPRRKLSLSSLPAADLFPFETEPDLTSEPEVIGSMPSNDHAEGVYPDSQDTYASLDECAAVQQHMLAHFLSPQDTLNAVTGRQDCGKESEQKRNEDNRTEDDEEEDDEERDEEDDDDEDDACESMSDASDKDDPTYTCDNKKKRKRVSCISPPQPHIRAPPVFHRWRSGAPVGSVPPKPKMERARSQVVSGTAAGGLTPQEREILPHAFRILKAYRCFPHHYTKSKEVSKDTASLHIWTVMIDKWFPHRKGDPLFSNFSKCIRNDCRKYIKDAYDPHTREPIELSDKEQQLHDEVMEAWKQRKQVKQKPDKPAKKAKHSSKAAQSVTTFTGNAIFNSNASSVFSPSHLCNAATPLSSNTSHFMPAQERTLFNAMSTSSAVATAAWHASNYVPYAGVF